MSRPVTPVGISFCEISCTFLVLSRKVRKEANLKGAVCRAPARQIRPFKNSPAALGKRWRNLSSMLGIAKMFRFLLCCVLRRSILDCTFDNAAGGYTRGAHLLEAPPCADFFGYFLVRKQESDIYPIKRKSPVLRRGIELLAQDAQQETCLRSLSCHAMAL